MRVLTGLVFASLAACGTSEGTSSTALTQEPGNCGSMETHVFGIYESPNGRVSVHIERPGNHVVVVSAHEATTWKITAAPGATIDAIYATGIHRQTIIGPAGVQAVSESKDDGDPYGCGYAWPTSGLGCDTKQLVNLVEKRVHAMTSFHGCYTATQWTLGDDLGTTGDCNAYEGTAQTDYVQGCDGEDSCGGPIFL